MKGSCLAFKVMAMALAAGLASAAQGGEISSIQTDEAFANIRPAKGRVTLIFFTAAWAGPAVQMEPQIRNLAGDPSVDVYIVDIEKAKEAPGSFQISSIPATVIFDAEAEVAGKVIGRDFEKVQGLVTAAIPTPSSPAGPAKRMSVDERRIKALRDMLRNLNTAVKAKQEQLESEKNKLLFGKDKELQAQIDRLNQDIVGYARQLRDLESKSQTSSFSAETR